MPMYAYVLHRCSWEQTYNYEKQTSLRSNNRARSRTHIKSLVLRPTWRRIPPPVWRKVSQSRLKYLPIYLLQSLGLQHHSTKVFPAVNMAAPFVWRRSAINGFPYAIAWHVSCGDGSFVAEGFPRLFVLELLSAQPLLQGLYNHRRRELFEVLLSSVWGEGLRIRRVVVL